MADAFQILPDDSGNTGKRVDCESLTVAGQLVFRQRVQAPELAALMSSLIATQPALQGGAVPVVMEAGGDAATATLQASSITAINNARDAIAAAVVDEGGQTQAALSALSSALVAIIQTEGNETQAAIAALQTAIAGLQTALVTATTTEGNETQAAIAALQTAVLAAITAQRDAIVAATSAVQLVGVRASNNVLVPVDSLAQTLGRDGSGNLTSITVQFGGVTYVQTLGYSAGLLSSVSAWVAQ